MQQWNWIKLNPNGTIDLDVSQDPDNPQWLHIGRAKVGHLRDYGLGIEDADDLTSRREVEIRHEAGYTDEVKELWLKVASGNYTELDAEASEMLNAADASTIARKYESLIQRFLLGEENPYPRWWCRLLTDASLTAPTLDAELDTGDLPIWAFGQEVAQAVVSHWQTIPLTLGVAQEPPAPPAPNRATRRART